MKKVESELYGSGCGSVGRAVASDTRGPQFDSSHAQKYVVNVYYQLRCKDEKIKKKRPGNNVSCARLFVDVVMPSNEPIYCASGAH